MKRTLLLILSACSYITMQAQLKVEQPVVENLVNPIGIDIKTPRFSWKLNSPEKNTVQTAYQLSVYDARKQLWSSGKQSSDQSVFVPYAGPALVSNRKYTWQVKVWDNHGKSSSSSPASWQMGLLQPSDWSAHWIEAQVEEDTLLYSPHLFRKEFTTSKKIKSATAYITSHGIFEAMINGKRVGDAYLAPGWTSYNKRLQYLAVDITDLLQQGNNAIGVYLGSGWYRSPLAWMTNKNIYGSKLALLLQLNITYTDGSEEKVITDESWKANNNGPVRSSELYAGEIYDARMEFRDWTKTGFDDSQWKNVKNQPHSKEVLIAAYNEPIKKRETLKAVRLITSPKGEKIIDFGQNLVGWVEINIKGNKGDSLKIFHAEVLDKEGNFYTENLRAAKQENIYVLSGEQKIYQPHFTFQGFRYIKIEGYKGEIKPEDFTAAVLYSDMRPNGEFVCSNPMINQLQKNIVWGQKGNFLDVPTDCPQRDERLGWTGDIQVFARTAAFNMDVHNFLTKWLKDLAADQLKNGSVPCVIPGILGEMMAGSSGWSDASTIIPWEMYKVYGDKKILEEQYESMKAWVDYVQSQSPNNLWNSGHHFGDWLFYRPNDDLDGRSAITDKFLIAQCFWAGSTQIVINTAKLLNKQNDVEKYTASLAKIKEAFLKEYLTSSGRMVSGTQTAYVLALNFDMLPEGMRSQAADRLVENIKSYDYHLTTGFLGTPYLCHVLSRFGHTDIAYKLLLQDTYPSWLYPVKMGATTIWERWDGQKTDGTFQNPGMNSFNHYAYGAIGDWMYRCVTGIDLVEPGYKKFKIKPEIDASLNYARASYESVYGKISSGWERKDGMIVVKVTVPANTSAEIILPGTTQTVGSGNYEFNYLVE
jgi:alpha-L-rhamnosidase